eukprot:TRINITY_DN4786_c0_g1_i7.p1 TRINITY_DN4786_c0_g1~~TRINITY_DN4786_c0_g1_i7.p1  ORF type:complete len:444 (+),score=81.82 TRINITY_DN4786_c0_g1_i7:3-1334(+)
MFLLHSPEAVVSTQSTGDLSYLLLRGSKLVNTEYVLGVVAYAGADTKLALNMTRSQHKKSRVDVLVNRITIGIIIAHSLVCIALAIASAMWHKDNTLAGATYLNTGQGVGEWGAKAYLTFFALLSYCVPVSLIVIWEVVKLVQSLQIQADTRMTVIDEETGTQEHMKVQNLTLCNELSRVHYLFSDKTGTLTENKMVFDRCTINGVVYNRAKHGELLEELQNKSRNKGAIKEFLLNMSLNHSSVPVTKNGELVYKGPSPDEEALLIGARDNGFKYLGRTTDVMDFDIMGKQQSIKLLYSFDFTPQRSRSSVVVKLKDRIMLYAKGSDRVICQRLDKDDSKLQKVVQEQVNAFCDEGLRTLLFACKELDPKTLQKFSSDLAAIRPDSPKRDTEMENLISELETSLHLQGATGVEDKLQEEVPETIQFLLDVPSLANATTTTITT